MKNVLDYLAEAEGIKVHRISSEKDITAPYGIYKHVHKDAEIFKYIESVAKEHNILKDSKDYTKEDLSIINNNLHDEIVYNLVEDFFKEYLKNAHINEFPQEVQLTMFSLYTNSPKGAWLSTQKSLINLKESNVIDFPMELSKADGIYGEKTKNALNHIKTILKNDYGGYLFKTLMISNMKTYYLDIIKKDKNLEKFRKGWDNRLNYLLSHL